MYVFYFVIDRLIKLKYLIKKFKNLVLNQIVIKVIVVDLKFTFKCCANPVILRHLKVYFRYIFYKLEFQATQK